MNNEKPLIPNGQIEQMFLRICSDDQMRNYVEHVNSGNIALATAYASKTVTRKFFQLVEADENREQNSVNVEGN
jgi:hypothetical protein